jgi:hypothetical protein
MPSGQPVNAATRNANVALWAHASRELKGTGNAPSKLCRKCRSVEALAPVRNAAGDREHRADMKIKQVFPFWCQSG